MRTLVAEHPAVSAGVGLGMFSFVLVLWAGTRPGFDPFGWLVWGHQTLNLSLNTNGAPSWKPLPYLFTVPFAITGHYAMWLWMFTSTALSLSGVIFAARIAYRLTGAPPERRYASYAAAVFAGLGVLGIRGYMHYILSAQSDTVIVSLCLGAIDCHLSKRPRWALALAVLASLGRPEAWPFAGLYALWAWRTMPSMRRFIVIALAFIPLLWFGIPALTANSFFVAGNLALHSTRALQNDKVLGTLDRFLDLHEWPLQLATALAVVLAVLRRDRTTLVLAGGVIGWVVIEIAFALHGWPGLDRYMFEAAGVMVVLGGVAVGWVLAGPLPRPRAPRWAGIVLVALLVGSLAPAAVSRVRTERKDLFREHERARQINRLHGVIARLGGPARILACGQPLVNLEFQSVMAWEVGINVGRVGYHPERVRRIRSRTVWFRPHGFGWRVRTIRSSGSCQRLRASTPSG